MYMKFSSPLPITFPLHVTFHLICTRNSHRYISALAKTCTAQVLENSPSTCMTCIGKHSIHITHIYLWRANFARHLISKKIWHPTLHIQEMILCVYPKNTCVGRTSCGTWSFKNPDTLHSIHKKLFCTYNQKTHVFGVLCAALRPQKNLIPYIAYRKLLYIHNPKNTCVGRTSCGTSSAKNMANRPHSGYTSTAVWPVIPNSYFMNSMIQTP